MQKCVIQQSRKIVIRIPAEGYTILCQQGKSGRWYGKTESLYPMPYAPQHIYGHGETPEEAAANAGKSIRLLRRLNTAMWGARRGPRPD
jgi:predicted RNase H-like HicB family nuclease